MSYISAISHYSGSQQSTGETQRSVGHHSHTQEASTSKEKHVRAVHQILEWWPVWEMGPVKEEGGSGSVQRKDSPTCPYEGQPFECLKMLGRWKARTREVERLS